MRHGLSSFLLAVPAALGFWMASFLIWTVMVAGPVRAAMVVPYALMGGLLFGAPLVLGTVALVAAPLHSLLHRTIGVTRPMALAGGAACGLLVRECARVLWGQPELGFLPVPVVLVAGIGTAWVWWNAGRSPGSGDWTTRGAV